MNAGLQELTTLTPDPDRAARVRARCRAELAPDAGRQLRTRAIADFAWRVLAPATVGALCLFYVAVLVATTLRLKGIH